MAVIQSVGFLQAIRLTLLKDPKPSKIGLYPVHLHMLPVCVKMLHVLQTIVFICSYQCYSLGVSSLICTKYSIYCNKPNALHKNCASTCIYTHTFDSILYGGHVGCWIIPEQGIHGHDHPWAAEPTLGAMGLHQPLLFRKCEAQLLFLINQNWLPLVPNLLDIFWTTNIITNILLEYYNKRFNHSELKHPSFWQANHDSFNTYSSKLMLKIGLFSNSPILFV